MKLPVTKKNKKNKNSAGHKSNYNQIKSYYNRLVGYLARNKLETGKCCDE
jgi:effector-binding domain-containing protein